MYKTNETMTCQFTNDTNRAAIGAHNPIGANNQSRDRKVAKRIQRNLPVAALMLLAALLTLLPGSAFGQIWVKQKDLAPTSYTQPEGGTYENGGTLDWIAVYSTAKTLEGNGTFIGTINLNETTQYPDAGLKVDASADVGKAILGGIKGAIEGSTGGITGAIGGAVKGVLEGIFPSLKISKKSPPKKQTFEGTQSGEINIQTHVMYSGQATNLEGGKIGAAAVAGYGAFGPANINGEKNIYRGELVNNGEIIVADVGEYGTLTNRGINAIVGKVEVSGSESMVLNQAQGQIIMATVGDRGYLQNYGEGTHIDVAFVNQSGLLVNDNNATVTAAILNGGTVNNYSTIDTAVLGGGTVNNYSTIDTAVLGGGTGGLGGQGYGYITNATITGGTLNNGSSNGGVGTIENLIYVSGDYTENGGATNSAITIGGVTTKATDGGSTTGIMNSLQIGNGGWTDNFARDIIVNSGRSVTFDFSHNINGTSTDITRSQTISGAGSLAKTGTGTLILTGNNSNHSGTTTVSGGKLSIGSDTNIGTGTRTLSGASSTSVATLVLTGTGTNFTKGWTLSGTNNAIETPNSATLSGVLSGTGGFAKTGTGTLTLSGANTYTGDTLVNAGTLDNRGTINRATVNSGTLANSGTVNGTATVNGGNLTNYASGTVGTLAMLGGTVSNAGWIGDMIYSSGSFNGAAGEIGSLAIAGYSNGNNNFGNVNNLSFDTDGRGYMTINGYVDPVDGGLSFMPSFQASTVDLTGANLMLDLAGTLVGDYGDFESWTYGFANTFENGLGTFGVWGASWGDLFGIDDDLVSGWELLNTVSVGYGDEWAYIWKDGGMTHDMWNVNDWGVSAVPEPATLALVALGLVGLGLARRRRM